MNGKTALILSIAVVVTSLGFLVYTGLNTNMVYYYHVDEFLPKAPSLEGEVIKVNGKVIDGTIQKSQLDYRFGIHGVTAANIVQVEYHGVVPDTFKNGSDVVVEGKYDPQRKVFHATTLLAKCPTKYEPQDQKTQQVKKTSL
jgi:cytochrome c-type biogenesis protein CcmE